MSEVNQVNLGKYVSTPEGLVWVNDTTYNPNATIVPGTYYNNGNEYVIDNSLQTNANNPTIQNTDATGSWLGKFIGDKDFSPLALSLQGLNLLSNAYFGNKNYKLQKDTLNFQKAQGIQGATNTYLTNAGNALNNLDALNAFNQNAASQRAENTYAVMSSAANSLANLGAKENTYQAPLNQIDKYRTLKG